MQSRKGAEMVLNSMNQEYDEDYSGIVPICVRPGARYGWKPGLSREIPAEAGRPSHFAQPAPI